MNFNALSVSAGQGNKKAISKMKELGKELKRNARQPITGPGKMYAPRLTEEQMKRLGGGK